MYRLYYYPGNANLAPHMLLEEIGARYELVLVDRTRAAHQQSDYLALNPTGRIPVLIDRDLVLFETAAICLHLVDRHADAGLAPSLGTTERAHFYKWLVYLTNTVQAESLIYFYPERWTEDERAAAQVKDHAEAHLAAMLDLLDGALGASGGPYLFGKRYSAVDPYLMMLARWTRFMTRPARTRKHLRPFLDRMIARPAVQRAFAAEGIGEPYY
jgi:glutathione S-transferase